MTKLIRPSASLIIASPVQKAVSDSSNYRILFMKRNAKSSFINAHVYPGGVVDNSDHYSNWFSSSNINEKEGRILTNKICAIRETFEESGLLLSRQPHQLDKNEINLWRDKVHHDAHQFKVMCETFNLIPAVDQLILFSNWITPVFEKKRYDTLFFLTVLSPNYNHSDVVADGKETVTFDWFKPEEALEQHVEKKIILIPPQWYSLNILKGISDYRELNRAGVDVFRTRYDEVIKILPQGHSTDETSREGQAGYSRYLAYPGDEMYCSKEYRSQKGNRHRLYFKGKMEEFILDRNVQMSSIVVKHRL